jgi:hypothetical protein
MGLLTSLWDFRVVCLNAPKYPRFKSKHGRQSIQYPQRVKLDGNRIYLPKVGWVKGIVHREIVGKLKTVTVSRNACGQFCGRSGQRNPLPSLGQYAAAGLPRQTTGCGPPLH